MNKVPTLNFHQTFAPEREHLSKILKIAESKKELTKEQIFEMTGIPTGTSSGKVVPHIKYAEYMGLIKAEHKKQMFLLSRTKLGEVVLQEDPYISEPITQLIAHYFLTSKKNGAILWSFIFRECIKSFGSNFSNTSLQEAVNRFFKKDKVNLSPVRSTYKNSTSFQDLNLVEIEDDWRFIKHEIDPTFKYLYGYTLLEDWEQFFSSRSEITLNEIVGEIGWNFAFNWDEKTTLDVLDYLSDVNVITINRQLNPVTIIKNSSSDQLLNQIYSLLI